MNSNNSKIPYCKPDENGKFGEFGGAFVSETLMPAVLELQENYKKIQQDPEFQKEFDYYLKYFVYNVKLGFLICFLSNICFRKLKILLFRKVL